MKILVLNVGSTSLKFDIYELPSERRVAHGSIDGHDPEVALACLGDAAVGITAVGHRVAHGGERYVRPVRIDDGVEAAITECASFAPLHNPPALAGIRAARKHFPDVPHVAVFDTAFHASMPPHAYRYAIPENLYLGYGIRRYGFHGPSHQYMLACAAEALHADPLRLRVITVHLGGGASVAAIAHGVSIDTSMGMTPLEGLPMATRCGDLDPAIPILLAKRGFTAAYLDELLQQRSGLAGLSGTDGDFREIVEAAGAGDPRARLALDVFEHAIRKYIGAYAAELGGADAIVFTGGIGEHASALRARVCAPLGFLGVELDATANATNEGDVSASHARTRVIVVHTEEERMIAREVATCLAGHSAGGPHPIPVDISARHVHLSAADCAALFGARYELSRRREVTQPGQFVARETVDLIGPAGELRHVAIVGPLRRESQVEITRSEAIALGIDAPLRLSGELASTPGIRMRGPRGEVTLFHGAIVAKRHVHMSPAEAHRFGVAHGDAIRVAIAGPRALELGRVIVRVDRSFTLDLHLDTDEANAAGVVGGAVATFLGHEPHQEVA